MKAEAHAVPAAPGIKDAFEAAREAFFSASDEKPQASTPQVFTQAKTGGPAKR